jgi:hypothetical protein
MPEANGALAAADTPADVQIALLQHARAALVEIRRGNLALLKELRKERGEMSELVEQYFVFTREGVPVFTDLAASETRVFSFRTPQSSIFYTTALTHRSPLQADPLSVNQPFLWNVTSQSEDLVWSNNALHSEATLGSGERPHFLARPRPIRANSEIRVELTNLSAANPIRVFLYFVGWKFYYKGRVNQTAVR